MVPAPKKPTARAGDLSPAEVARARRVGHLLAGARPRDPAAVVTALLALQAQEYRGALWSLGARTEGATAASIEAALAAGAIVRTWPMRGTLHVVAPGDLRWLLALLGPRTIRGTLGRARGLGIEPAHVTAAARALTKALRGGRVLARDEALACLEKAGIGTGAERGVHLLVRLAIEGVLCLGPRAGAQPTYALLDEWVAGGAVARPREQALTELATRYFAGHGPATLADLAGWAAITVADARLGIAGAGRALAQVDVGGVAHWMRPGLVVPPATHAVDLLAGFDELVLGYKQRDAILPPEHARKLGGNGMFRATVAVDGRLVAIWTRAARARGDVITVEPFTKLPAAARPGLAAAAARHAAFLGRPVEVVVA